MRFRPCIDIHNGKVKQIVGQTVAQFVYAVYLYCKIVFSLVDVCLVRILHEITFPVITLEPSCAVYRHDLYTFPSHHSKQYPVPSSQYNCNPYSLTSKSTTDRMSM